MASDIDREVEVLGLTGDIDDDFLQLYFENKRRSGGGSIQSFTRNGAVALITFVNPEDAESVLTKEKHHLSSVTVQVRRPPPWDSRKAALIGLDPDIEEALLDLYVEAVSGREVFTIVRSADRRSALISFQEELSEQDLQHFFSRVKEKRLHQCLISAHQVRVCGDILVEKIGDRTSADLLEIYFESKRSGGGSVRAVTMLRNNSAAVVSFCDWNVVDNVLCRPHTLQDRQLSVSPYYPDLLGNLNSIDDHEEKMEEEEPIKSTGAVNIQHDDARVLGAPTKDTEPTISRTDEMLAAMEVGDAHCFERSELPQKRPKVELMKVAEIRPEMRIEMLQMSSEMLQMRSEMEQMSPFAKAQGSTVNRHEDLGTLRTLHSSDTHKYENLLNSALTSMSGDDGERRMVTGEASNSVDEAEVIMDAAELLFMQKYHHELLAGMNAVTIFPLDDEERFGFKVLGDSFSCRTAVELLQHLVSSLSSHTITLEYPWVPHFLLKGEGQLTLRDTEKQYQCIIDTSQISWKVLDCEYVDPWSFVHDTAPMEVSPLQSMAADEVLENPLLNADIEGIKMLASLLKSEDNPDILSSDTSTSISQNIHKEDLEEDLYTDMCSKEEDSPSCEVKDEELDQVCQISRKEFQDRQLDEEAQLLLAIQRSMDTQGGFEEEDEELKRALEMSMMQNQSDDTEDSLQRALEMSIQDQRQHDYNKPTRTLEVPISFSEASSDLAKIRVLAGDETTLAVASTAMRKAITSKLNTVSVEATDGVQDISQILAALEKKHKVKITKYGRELQIHGFLQGPSQCRQEMSQILNALQPRIKDDVMDLDMDVEMVDVPDTSEEYQKVTQPFMNALQKRKLAIDVLQVQKVHNPLLYNQYQLKKLRTVMTDVDKPAERILYHGTNETSAKEIVHSGFNRSFCGKNATMYGQGVYFGLESEIATRDNYSPPNKEGKKFVFVARVLTGEYTQGKNDMRTPPTMPNATGDAPRRYDSLVNSVKEPVIFVIFNDTQAYPEYLITCSNRRDTSK